MGEAIKLPPRVDLPAAVRLVAEMNTVEGDINVDASDVTQLGALGVQALTSAARTAQARGGKLTIEGLSDKVIDQMAVMGASPDQLVGGME